MKPIYHLTVFISILIIFGCSAPVQKEAQRITVPGFEHSENLWYQLRAEVNYQITVPDETSAMVRIPQNSSDYKLDGESKYSEIKEREDEDYRYFRLAQGKWGINYKEV